MDVLSTLVKGMQANEEVLHYKSLNMVNLQTPSYRRAQVDFSALLNNQSAANSSKSAVSYDNTAGAYIATGRSLDIYLQPNIYMAVQDGNETIYGRFGQLSLSKDGGLSDGQGKMIHLQNSTVNIQAEHLRIESDGTLWNGTEKVASISLVRIDTPILGSDGYVRKPDGAISLSSGSSLIPAGYESSNTSYVDEIVGMMQHTRAMSGLQYAYKSIDGLYDKAISELGRF